jgi:(2Fe-2S) ferredoxin
MSRVLVLHLIFLSFPVCAMQPLVFVYNAKVYNGVKTGELKELLNGHILSNPLPHIEIKQLVLDGADPNVKADESHYKECSWFEALFLYSHECAHFWDTIDFLFLHGASPNLHPKGLLASLCYSSTFEDSESKIAYLIRYGADICAQDSRGQTPLFNTICGYVLTTRYGISSLPKTEQLVERLLELGAICDIVIPDNEGTTPLSLVQNNELTCILKLFEKYKKQKMP